ncbi:Flagellar biosynthesis protein, FliO [Rubripirellula lacrimiformis]|uniref:Flagellar biosynthesis protein, FliO n=1 Tax=Rubripirellula lacrimiformis TaxID=1930273 RepID=A0A517N6B1_9BACT|nr:flagellar biosynthetic protein FliO [Rubripirellula lacrimiformis]QDT02667.1 Flagellar biosynthesis protein, FliO [Rubripirellula lacrimiformis]
MFAQIRWYSIAGIIFAAANLATGAVAQETTHPSVYARGPVTSEVATTGAGTLGPATPSSLASGSIAQVSHLDHPESDSIVTASASRSQFPTFNAKPQSADTADQPAKAKQNQFAIPAVTVTSSLAVVLGLFAAMIWLTRKFGSRSIAPGAIPNEVMEHLGSSAIDARTRLTMIRLGGRILVLSQTASEVRPLSEITDPEEVRRLTAACLGDSKRNFASTLQSIEKERPSTGFAGNPADHPGAEAPRPRGRLFASA